MESAKLKGQGNKLSAKLTKARKNEAILQKLANDIRILLFWLRNDILSLAGAEWSERMELMNFIVEELQLREDKAHKGIRAMRVALSNQKNDLLAFARILDQKLAYIAYKFQISLSKVRSVCLLMKKSLSTNFYWQKWNHLYKQLREKFLSVKEAVESAMKSTQASQFFSRKLEFSSEKLLFLEETTRFGLS